MTDSEKLERILALVHASMHIEINPHRNEYLTVANYLEEEKSREESSLFKDVPEEIQRGMVANDSIITIQAYPHTPVTFHWVAHYDFNAALDEMLNALEAETKRA